MGTILLLMFIGMMVLGIPIAVSLGLASALAVILTGKYEVVAVIHRTISGADSYVLLAIPFFILAGEIMNSGGITTKIFRFANVFVGHVPGGMGHGNVIANIIVSGMSGSAVADAGGLGKVIIKAMKEQGYDAKFCAAVTCAAATIGPIIPPSIPMVVFGAMAEVSVGKLFAGGLVPGLLLGITLMILVYIIARKRHYPVSRRATLREVWDAFREAFLALLTPIIIIGGILTGVTTPTEAAVIATVYAFFLSAVVYRDLTLKALGHALLSAAVTSATIIFIIASATAFSYIIAMEGLPEIATDYILSLTTNPYLIVLMINVVLLIMGCFMEALSILTITVPFMMPLIHSIGLDPVHLGVMVVLNLMIGLSTPPVGMTLFVCAKITPVKLELLYKEILPFFIPLLLVLAVISFFPDFVLVVPNMLFNR